MQNGALMPFRLLSAYHVSDTTDEARPGGALINQELVQMSNCQIMCHAVLTM